MIKETLVARKLPVRKPLVQAHLEHLVDTHGGQDPVRGVWHDTESGDYAGIRDIVGIANYWHSQGDGLGAHLIIDKEGFTGQCANFEEICWAVRFANTGAIHVELIGFARFVPNMWWARRKQLDKLAKWMAYLNKEYGIPIKESRIAGWSTHEGWPGNDHTDPGRFFPKKYVVRKALEYRRNGWS